MKLLLSLRKHKKLFTMANLHEKLQSQCHVWLHNEHPDTRGMAHANFNGLPLSLEGMLPVNLKIRIMSTLKAVGLVKGVLDYQFYWKGRLFSFDFKVGGDRLSKEQLEYIRVLTLNGGAGMEIRSLEQFQTEIEYILKHGCLTTEEEIM